MRLVHETATRLRVRFDSPWDSRLHAPFPETLRQRVAGVRSVRANPAARSLVIHHEGEAESRDGLWCLLAATPADIRPRPRRQSPGGAALRNTLLSVGVGLAGPLLPAPWRSVLTGVLMAPLVARGAAALVERGLTVEGLDALALLIAWGRGDHATAAATLALLHLGETLEAMTTASSDDLLRHLLHRPPEVVWVEQPDGTLVQGPADAVRVDDILVVGPGDTVPVDGQVVSGAASVNEAAITGESVPADREAGQRVLAGGVVAEGRLRIRAVKVGADTTTARIATFIEEALGHKPAIQTAAERLADQRVALTVGLGALTFALTRDPRRLAAVFLVDYSCALKLGAPVAVKAALARAARAGVLIKGGPGLEGLAGVDTVVFDKTGTLTHGRLEVTDVVPLDGAQGRARLLALLASLEEHATHPVADAIVAEARRHRLEHVHHDEVDFIIAHGVVSEVDNRRIVVGSRHFLEEHHGVPFAAFETLAARLEAEGRILLYAAQDGQPLGLVGLRDHARPEAAAVLARLRAAGVRSLVLLTGDREAKARALGDSLGFDRVFAEQTPEDKAAVVRTLQAEGAVVGFVGDGVNDAPALVAAHMGIAMPRGADLARATADMVLLRDHLSGLADARELADDTLALIRSNFRWAVGLNTVLFLGAVTGRASPTASALIHNGVTVGTLLRALAGPVRRAPLSIK